MVVTFLGSLVQSCCGERGTLQRNIIGVCVNTGSAHSDSAALGLPPPLTSCVLSKSIHCSGSGCSAGNCLRWALGCMPFPGLSLSGSGSRVLHKGTDLGLRFVPIPGFSSSGDQVLGERSRPELEAASTASPVPAARFSGCNTGTPSQVCRVSLLGSCSLAATLLADVNRPEFQELLGSSGACLQCGRACHRRKNK